MADPTFDRNDRAADTQDPARSPDVIPVPPGLTLSAPLAEVLFDWLADANVTANAAGPDAGSPTWTT